ncbi:hypothetical protein [Carboxylicivirga sp. RSCT41]|uniref:hypothetical protein n=1 Tax=Carboxylicivirga agarovorans TaxID=3417570 RepID=UPI003D342D3F
MTANKGKITIASDFKSIAAESVEFITFFDLKGFICHYLGEQIIDQFDQVVNDIPFEYAFVNMIGRDFIIVREKAMCLADKLGQDVYKQAVTVRLENI